jgi:hypothetical protein
VRDGLSLQYVTDCGVVGDHVMRIPDAAFLWRQPEIFRQLGLQKYQVPFTSFQTPWCQCASGLLADLDEVRATLPDTVDRVSSSDHRARPRRRVLLI